MTAPEPMRQPAPAPRAAQSSGSERQGVVGGVRDLFSSQRATSASSIPSTHADDDEMMDDDELEEGLPSERGVLPGGDDDDE